MLTHSMSEMPTLICQLIIGKSQWQCPLEFIQGHVMSRQTLGQHLG